MTVKICHITSAHNSSDGRILKKECVSLAKDKENDVYLVAKGDSYEYKGVHVVGVGEMPSGRLGRITKGTKLVFEKAVELDADIYHLHDPELLLYVKKLARMGKKVIFDSHEYYYKQILDKYYIPKAIRKAAADFYLHIENKACRYLSAAIFPCEIEGKHPFEGRAERCVFIDNFPIIEDDFEFRAHEKAEPVVCCVGSLTRERGIEQLVDACYQAGVKLIIGGNFSPAEFEQHMLGKPEFECVDYRGFCTKDQVDKIYRESSIGVSNILHTGQYPFGTNFPTKVYECMMYGLPFAISDFEYNIKMVKKYEFGLIVKPDDPADIAKAIKYLLDNPEEYRKMSINGIEAVKNVFNWKTEEEKLCLLYKDIMSLK